MHYDEFGLFHENAEEYGLRLQGVQYTGVAENIYRVLGEDDPVASALRSWMSSAGHRANILSTSYRSTGVGAYVDENGKPLETKK